jgi:hypothetical protein
VEPISEDRAFNEHLYQKGAQKLSYWRIMEVIYHAR